MLKVFFKLEYTGLDLGFRCQGICWFEKDLERTSRLEITFFSVLILQSYPPVSQINRRSWRNSRESSNITFHSLYWMFTERLPCARRLESEVPHMYIHGLWLDWAVHSLYDRLWQPCDKHTGNEITLYTIVIDICHHKFVHRIYNIKSEPNTNKGIWKIMMYQCRFGHDWATELNWSVGS